MKRLLFFILLLSSWFVTQAQPISGFYFGGNYTFVKDQNTIKEYVSTTTGEEYSSIKQKIYTPKPGWQMGYNIAIKIHQPLSLTFGANITNKKVHYQRLSNDVVRAQEDQETYYLCAPIAINYTYDHFFTGLGYEFGYDPGMSGILNLQEYTHAALIQIGYRLWFFNIIAKYSLVLNKQESSGYTTFSGEHYVTEYVPQNSILQLSLVIGSPDFKPKQAE